MEIELFGWLAVTVFQGALVVAAGYCLVRAMRSVREIGHAQAVEIAWSRWYSQAMHVAGMMLALLLIVYTSLAGGLWAVMTVSAGLLGLGVLQLVLVLRRLRAGLAGDGGSYKESVKAVVKHLQPDRVRGLDEDGASYVISSKDLRDFTELRGVVCMLNLNVAGRYADRIAALVPVMGFRGDDGSEFVLYADDTVVLG